MFFAASPRLLGVNVLMIAPIRQLLLIGIVASDFSAFAAGPDRLTDPIRDMPEAPSFALLRGTLVPGGVVCPLLEIAGGERVPLVGVAIDAFPVGTELALSGHFVERSPCRQGRRAFRVERADPVR